MTTALAIQPQAFTFDSFFHRTPAPEWAWQAIAFSETSSLALRHRRGREPAQASLCRLRFRRLAGGGPRRRAGDGRSERPVDRAYQLDPLARLAQGRAGAAGV